MMPKIPMTDEEIRMHKPVSPDFVDFRAGIRCAERVYQVAKILEENETLRKQLEQAKARAAELGELLREAKDQTRHSDYDWPIDLCHRIDAAMSKTKESNA